MKLRLLVASMTAGAVVLVASVAAGAAGSTLTVSDTTIQLGETVTVTLTTPCQLANGEPDYGNVIMSGVTNPSVSDNQETKGSGFTKGDNGVFSFPTVGTYTVTRFCDGPGMLDQVTITVTAPTPATTTTTAAPAATTTTAPRSTTIAAPGATTTTAPRSSTTIAGQTTTTVAASVAGVTSTKTTTSASSSTTASGATRVAGSVSYTG